MRPAKRVRESRESSYSPALRDVYAAGATGVGIFACGLRFGPCWAGTPATAF
jgi:hypothetical protein